MSIVLYILCKIWCKINYCIYCYRIKDLVKRGLILGKNVTIAPAAYIDESYPYLISIGDNCTVSNGVRLVAHDASPFKFTDQYTRLGKIEIKDNCYIGEKAIILPGVTIGPNVLIAAGSVVNRDIPPNSCVAGVPARFYAKFEDFIARHKELIKERAIFEYADLQLKKNEYLKRKVKESVQNGDAYVKGYVGKYPYTLNNDKT